MTPDANLCPAKFCESIERYVTDGVPTGGFLRSLLENDLAAVVMRADPSTLPLLPHIVRYAWDRVPYPAMGSPAKVEAWIARCRANRAVAVSSAPVEMKLEDDES